MHEYVIRSALEGHAIHTESCLHIQQDEDNVCAAVGVLSTVCTVSGAVLHRYITKRLQHRER